MLLHYYSFTALAVLVLHSSAAASDITTSTSPIGRNDPNNFFGGPDHNQEYLDWVSTIENSYDSALYLANSVDPNQGIAIHWSITENEKYLELGLAVRATGWLGFGLSENGGMTGSDMLLYEPGKNPDVVTDAFVLEERGMPQTDDCQNWELVSSNIDNDNRQDFLLIQVRRKLNTGDSQDLAIYNDSNVNMPVHRVIAAWGNEFDAGVSYHGHKTARGAVRWFSEVGDELQVFAQSMSTESDGTFLVSTKGRYDVKAVDTEYAKFCTTADDLRAAGVPIDEQGGMSLVGFAPIVDNVEHVHHFIVTASFMENNNVTTPEQCAEAETYFDMVYPWAPGDPPLAMPENVGFALGGANGYRSFQVEIHYDNPQLKQGVTDSSGVEFYYSSVPREHTAGFLVVGDSTVSLEGQQIARGLTDYDFYCPGECSTLALTDSADNSTESVTVVREYIHMHQSGKSAYNQHIRDGEVIRTGKTEYFDFEQQGAQIVQQEPFEIRPGDSFHTRCFFQNEGDDRKFGFASSDEMCMAFLLYYPAKTLQDTGIPWVCGIGMAEFGMNACETTWQQDLLTMDTSRAVMQRSFGEPSSSSISQCLAVSTSSVQDTTSAAVPAVAKPARSLTNGATLVAITFLMSLTL